MDVIQGCHDKVDNYIYSGNIVDTDKCTTIRDYVCYSSGSPLLEATSVANTSYNEDTSGYHGIVSYDRNNYAMKSSDVARSGNDRILAISLQDEDLPELPLDLSVSCISKRYVSSNLTCLQKEAYSDISQCPQPARQSPIASPDLTSLSSSSPLSSSSSAAAAAATSAAAAATAVVELNAFSIRNTSLSSIPTCFQEDIHGDPNQCRQSTNQSPIAPHDLTAAAAAAAAGATTAAEAEAAEAAFDLSVPSVRYFRFIPIRLQTKTQRASSQCPQTTNQPPIGPSELVAMAELCYLCGNQLCLSDKSETHICSKKLTFSSPNPVDSRTVYGNMTSPQSTDDSFGPRTRKRSASPEPPDEQSTRMPYVSEPDGGQVTSSLLPITPSINNITSSTSLITSSGSPLTNRSVLDTIIRTTLPTQQSALHNPRKKQVMTHEKDELPSGLCLQDSSNTTMTSLNKCNNARNIAASIQTPAQEDRVTIAGVRKIQTSIPVSKKPKIVRRLNFGFDTSSPVSGTIIKQAADLHPDDGILVCNDIDPGCNVVEVTAEAKAELQKIQNVIGDYICQLCNAFYEDAFKLAQHRCSKIVHVEYRCTECGKVFNCPANLASHSRWHKPASNDKKGMKAKGLPRNPSSAQRQPIQPDMMGDYVCKIVSSRKLVSAAKSVSSRFNDNKSSDSQHSKYLLPVTNVYVNVDQSKLQRYIPSNTELVAKTSNLNGAIHNTSVCQKEGVSDIVKYKQAQAHPHEDLLEKTHAASAKFISNSRSDHFVNSDHSAISQCNILHTSYGSYDSRLTQQEKPLVRDCLDSHSLQPQITSLSNANNEITHSLTDSLSNSDDTVYRTISKSSKNSRYTRIDDCKSNVACNNRSNLSTGTDTSSKTILIPYCPRPADFTRCHVGKLDSHQNGKMQNPIALSERQGNQQNECSVCGKRFQRHLYLQKHVQHQHRNENTFSCEKTTSTDNNVCRVLDGNTSGESGECVCKTTRLFCSNCDQVFTTQAAKLKHDAAMHGLRSLLSCNTCEMTFTSKTAADKHVRGAHKVDILSCKHCPSTFHSSQSLTRHINKCHPTENRQVILLQLSSVHTR